MKKRIALLFAVTLLALNAANAQTQITGTDTWNLSSSATLSGTASNRTLSSSGADSLILPYYTGASALTRVRIIYSAPLVPNSDTINSTLSTTSTSHFTSAVVSATTSISSSDLFLGLLTINTTDALKFNTGAFTSAVSDTKGVFDLTSSQTQSFTLTRNYDTVVLDTTDAAVLSFFTKLSPTNFSLQLASSISAVFARSSGSGSVTFDSVGTDSGTVKVIYDAAPESVPEPSTWAMLVGGVGMLAFGQRMRRR